MRTRSSGLWWIAVGRSFKARGRDPPGGFKALVEGSFERRIGGRICLTFSSD